ncbi:hypothetical protein BGZ49_000407 [Haplosporangium sp. Z 27]|nr:hypothetical protein BGZ49_000407 [Haplosporangium sp. Z 27]
MSQPARLARNSNNNNAPQSKSLTTPENSLAALASSGTGPRQSLSGLAKGGSGGTSRLSGLATTRKEANNTTNNSGSSILDPARGSSPSSSPPSTTATGAGGRLSGLVHLTSSTSTTTPSSSSTITTLSGSTPSLTQLATGSTPAPRRPLASLATSSASRSTLPSSTTKTTATASVGLKQSSVGLTPRTGGLLETSSSGLSGFGSARTEAAPSARVAEAGSPSLSSLLASGSSSQPRRSLSSLAGLSKTSNLTEIPTKSVHATTSTTTTTTNTTTATTNGSPSYTQPLSSETQPSKESDTALILHPLSTSLSPVKVAEPTIHDYSSFDYQTEDRQENEEGFSSLVAAPSQFAVSIFEKLDPAPSPIALSTNLVIQSNPEALYGSILMGSSTNAVLEAVTPERLFKFDTPSPDDKVFTAQSRGMRGAPVGAAAVASRS